MFFSNIKSHIHKNQNGEFIENTYVDALFYCPLKKRKNIKRNFKGLSKLLEQSGFKTPTYPNAPNDPHYYLDPRPEFKFKTSFDGFLANWGGVGPILLGYYFTPKRISLKYHGHQPHKKITELLNSMEDYLLNNDMGQNSDNPQQTKKH